MTRQRFSVDTNLLIYSIDKDAGPRHEQARDLMDALADADCVLTLQALAERRPRRLVGRNDGRGRVATGRTPRLRPLREAQDGLWRRETRARNTAKKYLAGTSPSGVRCEQTTHPSVSTVLYTDCTLERKIRHPTVDLLAQAAIASVAKADRGEDGIAYLRNATAAGIKTPLTDD